MMHVLTSHCITAEDASCSPGLPQNHLAAPMQPAGQPARATQDVQMPTSGTSGSTFQGAEELSDLYEGYMRPSGSHAMAGPPSPFNDMNMYDVSEHDQMLFLQAMNDMQTQNGAGEIDAFEDWLRG
jgi:hypothetical protein